MAIDYDELAASIRRRVSSPSGISSPSIDMPELPDVSSIGEDVSSRVQRQLARQDPYYTPTNYTRATRRDPLADGLSTLGSQITRTTESRLGQPSRADLMLAEMQRQRGMSAPTLPTTYQPPQVTPPSTDLSDLGSRIERTVKGRLGQIPGYTEPPRLPSQRGGVEQISDYVTYDPGIGQQPVQQGQQGVWTGTTPFHPDSQAAHNLNLRPPAGMSDRVSLTPSETLGRPEGSQIQMIGDNSTYGAIPPTEQQDYYNATPPDASGVTSGALGSYGNQSIDQWDPLFIKYGQQYGVDPRMLKAMADVESGGNGNIDPGFERDDGFGDGPSVGMMQVKPRIWQGLVPHADLYTTEGQIEAAAAILAHGVNDLGYQSHRDALFGIYFPTEDPNGTTQGSYGARVDELMAQMGTAPVQAVAPEPQGQRQPLSMAAAPVAPVNAPAGGDAVSLITNGFEDSSGVEYGFRAPASNPSFYDDYGEMWPDAGQHPGSDLSGVYGQEFTIATPGVVVCGGTDNGSGSWGWQCGAFGDTMNGASSPTSGRLEIYNEQANVSFIYGHSASIGVGVGQQVQRGQAGGTMGWPVDGGDGNTYGHVHFEARTMCPGASVPTIIDPLMAEQMVNAGATAADIAAAFCG